MVGSSVFSVKDAVTHFYAQRGHFAIISNTAGANCDDLTALRFLLCGVRDDNATLGGLFCGCCFYKYAVR